MKIATAENDVQVITTNFGLEVETIRVGGSNSKDYDRLLTANLENFGNGQNFGQQGNFISGLAKAMKATIRDFYVPVCDSGFDQNGKIQFVPGLRPISSYAYSYSEYERMARENGLQTGDVSRWYLYCATMANRLIDYEGYSVEKAIYTIAQDSSALGNYYPESNIHRPYGELTGAKKIAGKCDLMGSFKLLPNEERAGCVWIAGGCFELSRVLFPLASLYSGITDKGIPVEDGEAWFIIT